MSSKEGGLLTLNKEHKRIIAKLRRGLFSKNNHDTKSS